MVYRLIESHSHTNYYMCKFLNTLIFLYVAHTSDRITSDRITSDTPCAKLNKYRFDVLDMCVCRCVSIHQCLVPIGVFFYIPNHGVL